MLALLQLRPGQFNHFSTLLLSALEMYSIFTHIYQSIVRPVIDSQPYTVSHRPSSHIFLYWGGKIGDFSSLLNIQYRLRR